MKKVMGEHGETNGSQDNGAHVKEQVHECLHFAFIRQEQAVCDHTHEAHCPHGHDTGQQDPKDVHIHNRYNQ